MEKNEQNNQEDSPKRFFIRRDREEDILYVLSKFEKLDDGDKKQYYSLEAFKKDKFSLNKDAESFGFSHFNVGNDNSMYLVMIWLSNNCRGQGIGSSLLELTEQLALEKDCTKIMADFVDIDDDPFAHDCARKMYEHHGYDTSASIISKYLSPNQNDNEIAKFIEISQENLLTNVQ